MLVHNGGDSPGKAESDEFHKLRLGYVGVLDRLDDLVGICIE